MFGLSFLSPWFLAGLAAVAAPFVLHLFARETAPLADFPMARFVPRAAVHQTRRRRLQDLLLLALRALAVVLLALVFARPFIDRPLVADQDTLRVLALDRSFSTGGRRAAALRRAARAALDEQPAGAPVALVAFDQDAQVVVAPTSRRAELAAAIDAVAPGFGSTNYSAAVRAAIDLARRRPAILVIVTDGQRAGAEVEALPPVPQDLQLVVREVPPPPENLSLDLLERDDTDVVALVRNHGLAERRTQVRWTADGRRLAEAWIDVPAGASREARLGRRAPERAVVAASIDDAAGFEADNTRYLVTDPAPALPVWLVRSVDAPADTSFYVRAALESAPTGGTPFEVTVLAADDPRLADAAALVRVKAIAVVGTRGLGRAARDRIAAVVRNGTGLLVAAGPDVEAGVVREILGAGDGISDVTAAATSVESLAAADVRHPVLAALGDAAGNLGQVRVERAWTVRDLPGATTLLTLSSGRPALSELSLGRGRVFLCSTDLARRWNAWPLHPTFMPFVVEAIRYVSNEAPRPRDVLVSGTADGDASRPGVLTRPDGERVAVNVDPRESRLETLSAEELLAGVERVPRDVDRRQLRAEAEQGQRLWRVVLLALLLVLALEALAAGRERPGQPLEGRWTGAGPADGDPASVPAGGSRA